jgi:hypothetical protein
MIQTLTPGKETCVKKNLLWLTGIALFAVSCATVHEREGRIDDRREAESRRGHWQLLGERDVDFKNDHDRIDARRAGGPFGELRLEVREAPVEIRELVVKFGNGETFKPKLNARFAEGQGSRIIDLPGNRRSIDAVEFVYRSINRREGKGKVLVYAR